MLKLVQHSKHKPGNKIILVKLFCAKLVTNLETNKLSVKFSTQDLDTNLELNFSIKIFYTTFRVA
jgi:hypothetical protein